MIIMDIIHANHMAEIREALRKAREEINNFEVSDGFSDGWKAAIDFIEQELVNND